MILLRLLSWPYLRKHVLRWTLTVAGIVLGVAVFVAMRSANESVLAAFDETVNRIAGATQLQISAGEFGFEEAVLEKVQAVPEVGVAVPVIQAEGDTGLRGQGSLLILAVDMTGDRSLRDYDLESGDEAVIDDPLVFLAQPDSIMVTREFAGRNHLGIDSRLPMRTAQGEKQFVVRGIMKPGGLGQAFGGNLAIMDIYAAQKVFGRGQRFDRIDVRLKDGVAVAAGETAIRKAIGPGFEVEPPSARGRHFEAMMMTYSTMVNLTSVFALIIGMFIIYNAFAIAVTQRRSEIGILRALGATRAQVRALFLTESVVAGLIGSALGIAAGVLLADVLSRYLGGFAAEVWGVAQSVESVALDGRIIAAAIAIGTGTSVVAAWIPARNAARVDPVQALQKGKYQVLTAGENRRRRWAAAISAAGSAACLLFGRSDLAFYGGYALAIFAALFMTPALALWLARMLRPALRRLRPVEGALAADSLIQAPRRTSATVAALMLSLSLVIGLGGISRSSYKSITDWLDTALNPDLYVTASDSIVNRNFAFPGTIGPELENVEGVAQTQMVRSARMLFRGVPVTLVAVQVARLASTVHRKTVAGDPNEMYRLAAEGKGVVVSDSFAGLRGVRYGETIELGTPSGVLRLPVAGITRDYSDQQGSVLIDREVYKRWWKDDTCNIVRVYVKRGADPAVVKQRILEHFAGRRRLFVLANADVRRYILRLTDQWFAITYNQIAVAILVAVLGIVNTLIVSITDRRRELGVLQAVGALRRQIRHTVWMEAASIALVGVILGLALGAVDLYYSLGVSARFSGMALDYNYPAPLALLLFPLILGVGWIAALGPAETAVRGSLVEALEYE